ncbi:MAG: alcohol dehydrogenase catalytic domain-containing protein, partial [Pseudomonadota bacterium]
MHVKAAVMRAPGAPLSVETLELAPPKRGEVLIRMRAAGVCHSDYHVMSGQAPHDLPVVLGHEGAGDVLALGEGVRDLAIGDRVVLSWIPYCGNCSFCGRDQTHLCQTYKTPLWAGTLLDGTCRFSSATGPVRHLSMLACWADHVVVPELSCVKIDPAVPHDVAALLGCAVTTGVGAVLNRAQVGAGQDVVVIGAGGVGLS